MTQYIDKNTLIGEIKKRKHRNLLNEGAFEEDIDILSFINTLKVKEVDLDSEIDRVWNETSDSFTSDCWLEFENIAKHFFKLGLKAQKGE